MRLFTAYTATTQTSTPLTGLREIGRTLCAPSVFDLRFKFDDSVFTDLTKSFSQCEEIFLRQIK